MKKIIASFLVVLSLSLVACNASGAKADKAVKADKTTKTAKADKYADDPSYAFGVAIGNSLKDTAVEINYDSFLKGVKDVMVKNDASLTYEQAGQVIQKAISEASTKKAATNLKKEADFLASNGKKSGVITTASGLQYEVIKEGTGASPKASDTVKVDYVGTLLDGTTFDSSIARGQPAEFPLSGVIPGWTEGIQLMKVGGKTKFYIPSKLGYGENGAGGVIGPNSTLIFEVDLLDVNPSSK
jgi:FKBP-type peptidyl-prolyl cis-trans isomerases 1